MRLRRLAGFLVLLLLGLGTNSALAQTPFYGFQGASFINEAPMDLAAAVSDKDPNNANSGDYLVQFTNGGRWVYPKNNTGNPIQVLGQWDFWCNGTGLQSCAPSKTYKPYDTQIAYDWSSERWIVAALSYDAQGTRGAYLYVAASQTANPTGGYYYQNFATCAAFNTPGNTYLGDNPIMGISTSSNGRVVIDLGCGLSGTNKITNDEVFDIDTSALESGGTIGSQCSGYNCTIFTADSKGDKVPFHLRPSNNMGPGNGIVLASFIPGPKSVAGLNLWKLTPGTTGTGSDSLDRFDPRDPQSPSFFYSQTPVMDQVQALVPQPGCSVTSNCAILSDTLDPIGGMIQPSNNGIPIYAVSFGAVAPDGTDSYALTFILNQTSGAFNFVHPLYPGAIVGYAESALDPDGEVVVNRTNFKSDGTGSHSAIDVINRIPIASAAVVKTYALVSSSTVALPSGACDPKNPWCRWGDYTAEVYDPDPACDAVQQGQGSECGLFWITAEWTDGTNQNSWVGAVTDDVLASEQLVTFAGYSNFGEFEAQSTCTAAYGSTTVYPPSGAIDGDVLVAVVAATELAPGTTPGLPPGWSLLPLANQGGGASLYTPTACGGNETAWVAVHTYSSSDTIPYAFTTSLAPVTDTCNPQFCFVGEAAGLLTSYRGAAKNASKYTAYAYPNPNTYISGTAPVTVPGAAELVNIFEGVGDVEDTNCAEQFQNLAGSPPATGETPATPSPGNAPFFDADVWTGASATLGGYSVWSACAYNYAPTTTTLPAFQIVLPPALSN